jgi:glycosyltransferase involved in cell wall biosynthesis
VPPVSVTIITLDESAHIAAAIRSAAWADEVIVVDAGSRDDTVALAEAAGARVFARGWTGYVDQKNHAASLASHDWIFSLDADERITPALADEIRAVLPNAAARGFRVPRVTFHLGRWIRTTDFYPDFQTRLYDRRAARWQGRHVHESVAVDGPVGQLTQELLHYSYRDLRDHLDRINRYTSLAARQMHEQGRRARAVDFVVHPAAAFVRNYLLRRGVLDGSAGLILSLVNAWSVMLKFAKLWELQRADSLLPTVNSQRPTANAHRPTGDSPRPANDRSEHQGPASLRPDPVKDDPR